MLMSDLLTKAEQSLIMQSFKARERQEPLNGDGFGVGWYVPQIDPSPCVFTSTAPAWSNRNLRRLAEKTMSGCFFAHVRAAGRHGLVTEANCHPFQYEQFLWMHNGAISHFPDVRRELRESLSDTAYDMVQGTTDTEHAFAVFIDAILARLGDCSAADMRDALMVTIRRLNALGRKAEAAAPSRYNFAVTDGNSIVAARGVTPADAQPHSLYYALGDRFENVEGKYVMRPASERPEAIIISSEPLTEERSFWKPVPVNHLLVVTPELDVTAVPIDCI
ncbi:MAG: class II glutamine amidotransferase [Paracoccaceae bacterium]